MKKTKLTIDLGNTQLTADQKAKLLDVVHKAVSTNVKPQADEHKLPGAVQRSVNTLGMAPAAPATAPAITINVQFKDTDASSLTAMCQGQQQTISESDNIVFDNIQTPGNLLIMGKSLGTTTVTITPCASPSPQTFPAGVFRLIFKLC